MSIYCTINCQAQLQTATMLRLS